MSDQQEQTRQYFDGAAADWNSDAKDIHRPFNMIEARNNAALSALELIDNPKGFLDVGCGTGQLAIAVAERNVKSLGIDFAAEMIDQCKANASEASSDAQFECLSFFDYTPGAEVFDLISAQGFIEYISATELDQFFSRCHDLLSAGGVLALGSRNRLFNVVSLNAYTKLEEDLAVLNTLLSEARAIHEAPSEEEMLAGLRQHGQRLEQPDQHPKTGIGVNVRYQYTPGELSAWAAEYGFSPRRVVPVNYHGLPISVAADMPDLANTITATVHREVKTDHRLVPYCSSFVLLLGKDK